MTKSPTASRRALGAELRSLRDAAGKKIEDAAERLECSTAKISRLETGKGKPKVRDVRDLLDFYGSTDLVTNERLVVLATESQEQDWLSDFRDVTRGEMVADHLIQYYSLERDASTLKLFEADLIHGLFQTEEYIDAICATVFPEQSEKERARFVEFRVKRQELLWRPAPPDVSLILSEAAVIRPVGGGAAVKRRQLEALLTNLDGQLGYVDFRVTPLAVEAAPGLGGPFSIIKFPDADQNVVYLESREGAVYLESNAAVMRYDEKFSTLERVSLTRDESLKRLAQEIEKTSLG